MNALLEVVVVLVDDDELELVGPPLIHWPTAPFKLATVPSAGAVNTAAARLFCAI